MPSKAHVGGSLADSPDHAGGSLADSPNHARSSTNALNGLYSYVG